VNNEQVNTAILERLEKVVESLQDNSVKMGQLLAVHNEKLAKQDEIDTVLFEKVDDLRRMTSEETAKIKEGCERDIRMIDTRLRSIEKKMWSIAGALTIISVAVSPIGNKIFTSLTSQPTNAMVVPK
jgi:uncharacterized protein YicC (UPF0701 family)|tara:strand:+ start:3062 stop:3442 length:381 start_codon:yes stop_codon:yes gene_type:complete